VASDAHTVPGRAPAWARVSPRVRAALGRVPQAAPVVRLTRRVRRRDLRVLAFHGVDDLAHFDRLVSTILGQYHAVTEREVAAAIQHGQELPHHPVWFTFDDGLRSTIDAGEVLARHGVSATAFVCPAVIGQQRRLWFQVAAEAQTRGMLRASSGGGPAPGALKSLPDHDRRHVISQLENEIDEVRPEAVVHVADLLRWKDQGHTVGNHTWDHPCLDTCDEAEQRRQVRLAHEALVGWGLEPKFLAYPNGNYTRVAEATARELGYVGALLFDHAVARRIDVARSPHRISRLRIDSDADGRRALSILSGSHSVAHHLVLR
jgi:peptidoglycan/xylan/chitin deacetylase (PgdA/CDA1 family)